MKKSDEYSREELWENKTFAEKLGLNQRSITPTTFNGTIGIEFDTLTKKSFYQERYSDGSHSVIRFCINLEADNIKAELSVHNQTQLEIISKAKTEVSKISKPKKSPAEELKRQGEEQASDSGTNITQNTDKNQEFARLIELTTFEHDLMQRAFEHLNDGNKTVLVDVFPRVLNGQKQGEINTKTLDTHTAILYKAGEKMLLIDPNNPQFSSHLSNFNSTIEALYTPNPLFKIYNRPTNKETGYAEYKWRDCIDVAVKLAFLLNTEERSYTSIKEVMGSNVVKQITNNDKIDPNYPEIDKPLRAKQSSNLEKINEINTLLNEISKTKLKKQEEVFEQLGIKAIQDQISQLQETLTIKKLEYTEHLKTIQEESASELTGLDTNYFNPEAGAL